MRARFPQLFGRNQIENVQVETAQDLVGAVKGEEPFAFKYVMEVGLGDSDESGEPPFGGFACAHAAAEVVQKANPQIVKGHRKAISRRNRVP